MRNGNQAFVFSALLRLILAHFRTGICYGQVSEWLNALPLNVINGETILNHADYANEWTSINKTKGFKFPATDIIIS
jgi:hypothetical protein